MRLRLYISLAAALTAATLSTGTALASPPPCSHKSCSVRLHAATRVKHWHPKGSPGEHWLLYLNAYSGGKRLRYQVLPGGCDASYSSAHASAVLHACEHRSTLDYVAFDHRRTLRVEYRYVKRR